MRFVRQLFSLALSLLAVSAGQAAHASATLFMEEPFGTFGAFNPTGHAAVYLSGVCADRPNYLRLCRPGEQGVVVSRYHHVAGYDWLAVPLIPYLYAVDSLAEKPDTITPALRAQLRDAYRRDHLRDIAPDTADGGMPQGEWTQLVGASYDRRIYAFQVATTRDQDQMLIAKLNDSRNHSHFNLFYRNCADFSRSILRALYPNTLPRNAIADFGLTTPKHLARSMMQVGARHPEMNFRLFEIPQVAGTTVRSHHVDGIAESLVRSKKYIVPLALVSPTTAVTLLAAYVGTGRFTVPKGSPLLPELVQDDASPQFANSLSLDQASIGLQTSEPLLPKGLACQPDVTTASSEGGTFSQVPGGGAN